MIARGAQLLVALAILAAASPARSDEAPAAAAPAAAQAGAEDAAPRVRASHRVEVIAPGERVDTVLDRMRIPRSGGAGDGAVRPALPVREPEGLREGARRPEGPGAAVQGQGGGGPGSAPGADGGHPDGGQGGHQEGNTPHPEGPRQRH